MKNMTAGHCDAAVATRTPGELQTPRGGIVNKALRGTVLCVALGLCAASLPASAERRIVVQVAPPVLQVEQVPVARPGYLWAPGYWRWQNNQHVWARGHWMGERRGQRYESPRWEQRGDRYHFTPERWQRDSARGG